MTKNKEQNEEEIENRNGLDIGYKENSFIYHPKSLKEFVNLKDQLDYFKKVEDAQGMYMTAMQLIPDEVNE